MKKNITISYTKVARFKACPQKYYLMEEYDTDILSAALPFGKAVELSVDMLFEGKSLKEAQDLFRKNWHTSPKNRWEDEKQIFDSEGTFYYASDFDENLITEEDEERIKEWMKELIPDCELTWDKLVDKFQGQVKNNAYIDPAERKMAHRVFWLSCLHRGEVMLEAFKEQLLPEVEKVLAAQKSITINNKDGDRLLGFIDYIIKFKGIEKPVLTDLKTAGKFYSDHDLGSSDQLGIYAVAEKLENIGYMVVLKNIKHEKLCNKCGHKRENYRKTNCEKCEDGKYTRIKSYGETQILTREIRDGENNDIIDDFSDVLSAIKNGLNWKNPSSCFDYNKKCEFYDFCWKGKSLDEIPGIRKKKD